MEVLLIKYRFMFENENYYCSLAHDSVLQTNCNEIINYKKLSLVDFKLQWSHKQ